MIGDLSSLDRLISSSGSAMAIILTHGDFPFKGNCGLVDLPLLFVWRFGRINSSVDAFLLFSGT
jgi:hypothetical protein